MGFESRAISAWVTEQIVTIFSKTCVKSRKHLRTKVTPDFYLTYSKNGGIMGSESE